MSESPGETRLPVTDVRPRGPFVAAALSGESMELPEALIRLAEAEDVLRAIAAGQVDAFVVSDGGSSGRVFTLSTADRPYRMFVEHMREGAATVSEDGRILFVNRRLAEMLSCSTEALVGLPLRSILSEDDTLEFSELRGPQGSGATWELELIDAQGEPVPVLVGSAPLQVDGDDLLCLTFTDLTAQKAQEREIARLVADQGQRMVALQKAQAALVVQATHDGLTGLPNRMLLIDRIDQALFQARRSGQNTAVFFIDLDRFKEINDSDGHAAGDLVLRRVAAQLRVVLRPMDTVARIGGDEFVVLAPYVQSFVHAHDIAERLVAELARSSEADAEESAGISASIGLTVSIAGRGTAESLMVEADIAMYVAKTRGGARAELFDETFRRQITQRAQFDADTTRSDGSANERGSVTISLHDDVAHQGARRRHEIGRELAQAIEAGELVTYFQPEFELTGGTLIGFEALVRWQHPERGLVPPAEFISIAEERGLIDKVGAIVLADACAALSRWRSLAPEQQLSVAVNISPSQLTDPDLAAKVRAIIEDAGVPASSICLELTESALMEASTAADAVWHCA